MSFIRKCSLLVYGNPPATGGTGLAVPAASALQIEGIPGPGPVINVSKAPAPADQQALDLSQMRIQFHVEAMDIDKPPTAVIRVLNLSEATAKRVQKEFQNVVLQGGYEDGAFGVLFQGSITRVGKGRLNNIESFVDIMASNLDAIFNFGVVNTTLKSGSSFQQRVSALENAVNSSPVAQGTAGSLAQGMKVNTDAVGNLNTGGTLPRGKVMFGLARDYLNDITASNGQTWLIGVDGIIYIKPLTGYLPDEVVDINAQTGMVGVPVATPQGIEVSCLMNPRIRAGGRIRLNNADITTTQVSNPTVGFPAYSDFQFFASTSEDGIYTAIVVEHEGDTRGEGADWLTKIVALNVDQSAAPGQSVAAY